MVTDIEFRMFGELTAEKPRNGLYKPSQFQGRGNRWVKMRDLYSNRVIADQLMELVAVTKDEERTYACIPGDLLFGRTSVVLDGVGTCSIVGDVQDVPVYESNIFRIRLNPRLADPWFYFYYFRSPVGRFQVSTIARQTAAAQITSTDLLALDVPWLPLPQQRPVADILHALDDKIELNRRMNETLEAMARALFQSWFVDFDPVHAKAEGHQPAGMDAETAALFPDGFETSVLGDIPRGWRLGTLGDIAENPRRGIQPDEVALSTPYIGLEHMPRRSITLAEWGRATHVQSNKFQFAAGEVLFGKLRPYFHKVGVAPVDGVCSTDILVVAPRQSAWFGFLLSHLSSDELIAFVSGRADGTRMPRAHWNDITDYQVALPDRRIATAFTEFMQPTMSMMHANVAQSQTLAQVRDTLLPKLLSGEVRVRDVSVIVEEALA